MDNRTYTYLCNSGHLYRYHIIQHEISNEEAVQHLQKNYLPDLELLHQLREFNEQLSKVSIKEMKMPSTKVLDNVITSLVDIVKDEIPNGKQRVAEYIDIRTKGDATREIASHAFIKTAYQNEFITIDNLEYTNEDIEFVLRRPRHFIEAKINPLFVSDWTPSIRKKHPKEIVQTIILDLLKDGSTKARMEIDQLVMSRTSVSKATVSNTLSDLLDQELIVQPKFGFYTYRGNQQSGGVIDE
jgi:broad-specificity NMP kinase